MRVVFINRYFAPDISATSQLLTDLAQRFVEQKIEVHVVCSRQLYGDSHAKLIAEATIGGVHVHRVRTTRFGRQKLLGRACDYLTFYLSALVSLLRIVRRGDVVIAKTDPPLISVVAACVTKLRGARLINWLQDVFPEVARALQPGTLPPWLHRCLQWLRDRSLQMAERNVVLGERMQRHCLLRGIPPSKLVVIENWADDTHTLRIDSSANQSPTTQLRAELKLTNKFIVGYSGNLGRAHDSTTILQAATLLASNSEIVFLMIGGGAQMDALKLTVERYGLKNMVFIDYRPRESLADSLATADVHLACLLPSLEGFIVPSKFYGIIAAARPVLFIGDTDGELAHVIHRAGCGYAVEIGEAAALAAHIETFRTDTALRLEAGARGRRLFERQFTIDAAAEKWFAVLAEVSQDQSNPSLKINASEKQDAVRIGAG